MNLKKKLKFIKSGFSIYGFNLSMKQKRELSVGNTMWEQTVIGSC